MNKNTAEKKAIEYAHNIKSFTKKYANANPNMNAKKNPNFLFEGISTSENFLFCFLSAKFARRVSMIFSSHTFMQHLILLYEKTSMKSMIDFLFETNE